VDEFARLTPAERQAILGKAKAEAFEAGRIGLPDLVKVRRSRKWGTTRTVAPLKEALK
jgi:hypothetical protein